MILSQHKLARTTPAVRAEIAVSSDSAIRLAERYNVSVATIYKWRTRDTFEDRSHTAHRLQTTLTPAQEAIVVVLRKTLLLPLDDLLAVTREFLSENVSRSGLDRCLRRHGVGNLHALKPATPKEPHKAFKLYAPGYLHMDIKYLPQMADETKRRYLFVAIDRATRWGSSIACPNPGRPRPMAWWNVSMVGSAMCSTRITSVQARSWSRRCCVMWRCITTSYRSRYSRAKHRCRR